MSIVTYKGVNTHTTVKVGQSEQRFEYNSPVTVVDPAILRRLVGNPSFLIEEDEEADEAAREALAETEQTERNGLEERAAVMEIKFHPSISTKTLRDRVEAAEKALEEEERQEADRGESI